MQLVVTAVPWLDLLQCF
eukprot:Gb_24076 [translate_table: standard]